MSEARAGTRALQRSHWSKTLKTRLQNRPLLRAPFLILCVSGSSLTVPVYKTERITITCFFGMPWGNLVGSGVLASPWLYTLNLKVTRSNWLAMPIKNQPGDTAEDDPGLYVTTCTSSACSCMAAFSQEKNTCFTVCWNQKVYLSFIQFRKRSEYNCKYLIVTVLTA